MSDVPTRVQAVLRDVFDAPELTIRAEMTADDFEDWDSFQHINVLIALEQEFRLRFTTSEIAQMKQPGENIGGLIALVTRKLDAR